MRYSVLCMVVLFGPLGSLCLSQPTTSGPVDVEESVMAAESLRRSALGLIHDPASTARAERIIVLVNKAQTLAPDDPRIKRLLAFVFRSRNELISETEAIWAQLLANPEHYAKALQWIRLRLNSMNNAEDKIAFLDSVVNDPNFTDPVKGDACSEKARVFFGQGDLMSSSAAAEQALKLDPYHAGALQVRFGIKQQEGVQDARQRAQVGVALVSGNPFSETFTYEFGTWLEHLGLHDEALSFLEHSFKLATGRRASPVPAGVLLIQYFNAMLDAGTYNEAVELFAPMLEQFDSFGELKWLMVEAYRGAGKDQEASDLIGQMDAIYQGHKIRGMGTPAFAMELAWFYVLVMRRSDMAISVLGAHMAGASADDQLAQRIIGAAEIASSDPELIRGGIRRLGRAMGTDAYAAAFLAEYYFSAGDIAAARTAIEAGAGISRSGQGFRFLRSIAQRSNIELAPTLSEDNGVAAVLPSFDKRYLQMGLAPQEHLTVIISPVVEVVGFEDAVQVRVTISNIGPIPIPLVQPEGGTLQPQMSIHVALSGAGDVPVGFDALPMITFPAPRYLDPGRSVEATVRLDVGRFGAFLTEHPFDELTLTVSGMLSPQQQGDEFFSGVPGIVVSPAKITRRSLLGTFALGEKGEPAKVYRTALAYIVRDIQVGSLRQRMRAARQTAALMGLLRRDERGRGTIPQAVRPVVTRGVVLRMIQEIMKDRSSAVRAELLSALQRVKLDEGIMQQLGRAVEDPSPLVRLRMAELIGTSRTPGRETIVDYLVGDDDEMVKAMAQAVQGKSGIGR